MSEAELGAQSPLYEVAQLLEIVLKRDTDYLVLQTTASSVYQYMKDKIFN